MSDFFISRWATITAFIETQEFPLGDWKNVFSWSYWTEANLESFSPYYLFGTVLFVALLIGLEVWRRRLKRYHQVTPVFGFPLSQIGNIFFFLLILVPAYWFFRVQQMTFVSSRLFFGLIILIAVLWISWVLLHLRRRVSAKQQSYLEQERFFRYLPNSPNRTNPKGRKDK